jgi:3-oxoacyl-[acyl-carrier protein] reductase
VVKQTLDRFGRIDAIVNNAGLAPLKPFDTMDNAEWHAVLDTNLSAAFYLCKLVWPVFRERGGGVVVNVSSLSARDPFEGFAAYGAAKAGLNIFSQALAREGSKIGVRVHVVAPGAVETEMFRGLFSEQQFGRDRTLDPAEVGRVIAGCICGDLACTSGEVLWIHK